MSREAFEAWAKDTSDLDLSRWPANVAPDKYLSLETTFAWLAWQAAQADAFERAARVCDELYDSGGTAYGCADAIRALAKEAT